MPTNGAPPPRRARRPRFGLRALLLAFIPLGVLLLGAAVTLRAYRSFWTQTISIRLPSSGLVAWDRAPGPIAAARPGLEDSARLLRSYGYRPRLLIECYDDTRPADVESLRQAGCEAGFAAVDVLRHPWPSPAQP